MGSIRCPVMIMWGKEDAAHLKDAKHPIAMTEAFRQKLPQAQVEIFSNCGHLPHEEQPDHFNQCALAFMKQVLSTCSSL